ncbi:sugar phosphate isomerase/epimerase family protein [Cohnella hongkongensis]|uniref:Xylose isomerase n=1 Tax=Cohnella hongkongensis TaxID=178337 RepID=A0ABV9FBT5_9BACL
MGYRYSVFLQNVGSCFDRYCPAYSEPFSVQELFDRAASIEHLSGVDIVLTPEIAEQWDEVKAHSERTGLAIVSLAVDLFTQSKFKQGSLSSIDAEIRSQAIGATKQAMDLASEANCGMVTIWPGQDGYDSLFQADYIRERDWFAAGVKEACLYRPDIDIVLEYKLKEPRTHSYVSTVGVALLMVNEIGAENCGIALDYGHALLGYENPAESVAMLKKYGNKLKHVHINDNYRHWDDDMIVGTVHTLEFLEFYYWLSRTEYKGWITVDQFPYRENGRDAVNESVQWLLAFERVMDRADPERIRDLIASKDAVGASRFMRKLLFDQ